MARPGILHLVLKSETRHALLRRRPWNKNAMVLMVAGLCYASIGAAYFLGDLNNDKMLALTFATKWLPMEIWGVIFIVVGLIASISAVWPPVVISWGYSLLSGISAAWAGFFLLGIIFTHNDLLYTINVALWTLLAFLWWAIGGWDAEMNKEKLDDGLDERS